MEIIKLKDEFIKLGQALKAAGLVETGAEAKRCDPGWSGKSEWRSRYQKR